ncbi:TIGR04141 family sporadically distributed protein [Candidatus Enterococcus mangumiae]|uniref:Sporadically distributed protein, TIGR04141 family n=1 Tax=Candidatus Enterococcus mangumiae TaxID=2230878 RepID=A0ABZ2SZ47_9ENTE|nr:TIGR04141 family sporadically distributed protein [Enterococcus sp. DIV1094]MBO0489299.1 TIGR04141 family sporadically distributed protein [Enterococcus sp. DIV1094]
MVKSQVGTQKLSIFLHEEEVESFDECIKKHSRDNSNIYEVKSEIGLSGKIYVHQSTVNIPDWKTTLEKLTNKTIDISSNSSNKAVVVFKYSKRYFSVVYGYGRSMLEEENIERNFGLVVAANLIDPKKIRSLNSMTLEDTIIDTQKQSIFYSRQSDLQVNANREILKSVSGAPKLESTAHFLVGTDSLTATRKMKIEDIKESIIFYYDTYKKQDYKDNGFAWLDNVKKEKDKKTISKLDSELVYSILNQSNRITIGPNRIMDWENIAGLFFKGIGKINLENLDMTLDYEKYIEFIKTKPDINILSKIKRDRIMARTITDEEIVISKVYDGIIYELVFEEKKYLLCNGNWFTVDKNFYEEIKEKISACPICSIQLSELNVGEREDDYNKRICDSSDDYELLDSKNYRVPGYSYSQIEPCDILTRDKKFIHVKKSDSSSKLSHLFSQGTVSAQLLSSDSEFRNHINKQVKEKLGKTFLKANAQNQDYEVVYAIVDKREKEIFEILPFFSMVSLAQSLDQLKQMQYKYSLMKIEVK